MMKKVLFVCAGNTCRSPVAQVIFNRIAEDKKIEMLAESAGLCAEGEPASENSAAV